MISTICCANSSDRYHRLKKTPFMFDGVCYLVLYNQLAYLYIAPPLLYCGKAPYHEPSCTYNISCDLLFKCRLNNPLTRVISLTLTCRRAPSSASTLRTLEILTTTCRIPPSPVSTLRTPEPELRTWATRLVAWVWVVVVVLVLVVVIVVVGGGAGTYCGCGGSASTSGWGGSSSTNRSSC